MCKENILTKKWKKCKSKEDECVMTLFARDGKYKREEGSPKKQTERMRRQITGQMCSDGHQSLRKTGDELECIEGNNRKISSQRRLQIFKG